MTLNVQSEDSYETWWNLLVLRNHNWVKVINIYLKHRSALNGFIALEILLFEATCASHLQYKEPMSANDWFLVQFYKIPLKKS